MKELILFKWRYCLILQLVVFSAAGAWAQSIAVKGKVTDDRGESLPGVTILEKGTTNGTSSDANGQYSLNVPSGTSTLVVSFIGYTTQEIPVNNRTTVHVSLKADAKALEEVVVVGYGEQKKVNLTGAISTVEAEALTAVTTGDISNALTGKLPG